MTYDTYDTPYDTTFATFQRNWNYTSKTKGFAKIEAYLRKLEYGQKDQWKTFNDVGKC